MNKKLFFAALASMVIVASINFTSCDNKRYITTPMPTVSFVNDIVPIFTSGACGCHNNGNTSANSPKPFSNLNKLNNGGDSVFYDAIYSATGFLEKWVSDTTRNGHPGGGSVSLTTAQISIIKTWMAQGAPDDHSAGGADGNVTFAATIQPIINSTCSGASCHGVNGIGASGPALNYASLSGSLNGKLVNYLNNNWSGMAGATISPGVTSTLKAWIAQGKKP
jgi:mono/diheme cytochrome c family protein